MLRLPLIISFLMLVLAGCTGDKTSCGVDSDCPDGSSCNLEKGVCVQTVLGDTHTTGGDTPEDTTGEDTAGTDTSGDTQGGVDTQGNVDTAPDIPDPLLCGGEICGPSEDCCDDVCTNISSTSAHCGACGSACPTDQRCSKGACVCPTSTGDCDGDDTCETDLLRSNDHCGACGRVCEAGTTCSGGGCTCGSTACKPGETCCGDPGNEYCAALDTDTQNCGACGTVCARGEVCNSGSCECEAGLANCDDNPDCETDIANDQDNCGSCNANCNDACCNGVCTNVKSGDPNNCGDCGMFCGAPGDFCDNERCECASGRRTNLRSDDQNCGACGNDCEAHANIRNGNCQDGACEYDCERDFEDCDPEVPGCEVNLQTDVDNCGTCGNVCEITPGVQDTGGSCTNGQCTLACNDGFGNCDGDFSNSCETPLNTEEHCGACGRACGTGASCIEGECVCPGAGEVCRKTGSRYTFAACDGTNCVLTCNANYQDCDGTPGNGCEANINISETHCGSCGRNCSTGQRCCTGSCRSISTDESNCGICGRTCTALQTCIGGVCQ